MIIPVPTLKKYVLDPSLDPVPVSGKMIQILRIRIRHTDSNYRCMLSNVKTICIDNNFFNIVLVLPDPAPKEKVLIRLRQNDPDPLDPDPPDPDPPDPDPPH